MLTTPASGMLKGQCGSVRTIIADNGSSNASRPMAAEAAAAAAGCGASAAGALGLGTR